LGCAGIRLITPLCGITGRPNFVLTAPPVRAPHASLPPASPHDQAERSSGPTQPQPRSFSYPTALSSWAASPSQTGSSTTTLTSLRCTFPRRTPRSTPLRPSMPPLGREGLSKRGRTGSDHSGTRSRDYVCFHLCVGVSWKLLKLTGWVGRRRAPGDGEA